MANSLLELKRSLRPISISDRISALLFKSPINASSPCEVFNQWLSRFLSNDPRVKKISEYYMTLEDSEGQRATFWVANYPHDYGKVHQLKSNHPHKGKQPSWKNILHLRTIQLSKREFLIAEYRGAILGSGQDKPRVKQL